MWKLAPNPTPDNEIKIKKPSTNVGGYFDSAVNWVTSHGTLVGTIVACLFFAFILRSVWTKLPKSVIVALVILIFIAAGYINVKHK